LVRGPPSTPPPKINRVQTCKLRTAATADGSSSTFSFSLRTMASAHCHANTVSSIDRTPQTLLQGRGPRRRLGNYGAISGKGRASRVQATVSQSSEVQVDLGVCPKGPWKDVKVVHFEGTSLIFIFEVNACGKWEHNKKDGRTAHIPSPRQG